MGRLQLFEICLSHGRIVYSPGESLAGTVRVRLGAPLPFRAIRVTCTGSCGVSNKANDVAWVVEEGYFNSSLSLADKGSLPAGEHTFPFQFLLPATAPTSFEGPFGKVVHQVRATIDTPRFSKDHKCSRVFYILSPLNLNSIPDIEQPNVASTTKKFSYKLVKTGSVVLTASTDLRGYVVGQVLRLQADIENQSGKATGPVVASLLQVRPCPVALPCPVLGRGCRLTLGPSPESVLQGQALGVRRADRGRGGGRRRPGLAARAVAGAGPGPRAAAVGPAGLQPHPHRLLPAGLPEGSRGRRDPPGLHRRYRCKPRPAEPPARPRAAPRRPGPRGALGASPGGGGGGAGRGRGRLPPAPRFPLHQEPLAAAAARAPPRGWRPCPLSCAPAAVRLHGCHGPLLRGRPGARRQHRDPAAGVQLLGLPL
ncbi:arrestin domain-containing protein 1 isoform X1 [Choloepus didactylus]|uniref:arrestin domain-containing protein 1 isoform X1 n=1 Tax=Choloepus didactylus TaxID=27675 RepID=UPI00189D3F77|nr:arrestin domain-containing protein 1 isoform X1 [Choloepus didactylus]